MPEETELDHDWRREGYDSPVSVYLPVGIPRAYQALIDSSTSPQAAYALRRQIEPSDAETVVAPEESPDPLGESRYCVTPHLVHQYRNRVLLLATGRCVGYCRYCFRRNFTARAEGCIDDAELDAVAAYLAATPAVREILVSGGDPLSASEAELARILSRIREARADVLIRLCTRAPIFAPELFTAERVAYLRSLKPLWLIPHVNHPAELGSEQIAALTRCLDAGISVQSQSVLLKGVNDSAQILAELFERLVCLGVKPGYLFQCDLAPGTSHFRVQLEKAYGIWNELRSLLSGLSLPVFTVDLPGGGGKFPLDVAALAPLLRSPTGDGNFSAVGIDGKVYSYHA